MMLKVRHEVEVLPPKGNGSGGKDSPKNGSPKGSCVEQLSSKLKQLKLQRKIDKFKKKLKNFNSRN
jgi:hypothetical protein